MTEKSKLRTKIIANPRSANGRTKKNWPRIEEELKKNLDNFDVEFTQAPLDAARIASESLAAGYEMIVCVGGDGTINETINGFFRDGAPIRPDAILGIIPAGTGGDFIKTTGIPKSFAEAIAVLRDGEARPCDIGCLDYTDYSGDSRTMYFINIADFGLGGEASRCVNSTTKILGGFLTFLIGVVRAGIIYRNKTVTIEIDGAPIGERKVKNVIIANGQYFGGGMHIASRADYSDGLFDILILGDLSFIQGIRVMPRIYAGTVHTFPKVEYFRARQLRAASAEQVLLDVDGELPGVLPITATILPGAIRIKIPQPFIAKIAAPPQ